MKRRDEGWIWIVVKNEVNAVWLVQAVALTCCSFPCPLYDLFDFYIKVFFSRTNKKSFFFFWFVLIPLTILEHSQNNGINNKIKKNIGPGCDPWGTPESTPVRSFYVNSLQSNLTNNFNTSIGCATWNSSLSLLGFPNFLFKIQNI